MMPRTNRAMAWNAEISKCGNAIPVAPSLDIAAKHIAKQGVIDFCQKLESSIDIVEKENNNKQQALRLYNNIATSVPGFAPFPIHRGMRPEVKTLDPKLSPIGLKLSLGSFRKYITKEATVDFCKKLETAIAGFAHFNEKEGMRKLRRAEARESDDEKRFSVCCEVFGFDSATFSLGAQKYYKAHVLQGSKEEDILKAALLIHEMFRFALARQRPSENERTWLSFGEKIEALTDQKIKNDLYDFAFKFYASHKLHQPSLRPGVDPSKYCINLTWFQGKPIAGEQYPGINPIEKNQEEKFAKKMGNSVIGWIKKNPGTPVYFSYYKHTSPEAIENMKKYFHSRLTEEEYNQLRIEDSGTVPYPISPDFFAKYVTYRSDEEDKQPGWFFRPPIRHVIGLVDYHKSVIHGVRQGYFRSLAVDFDAEPMSLPEVFDRPTENLLEKNGYVVSISGPGGESKGYENGFVLVDTTNKVLKEAFERWVPIAIEQDDRRSSPLPGQQSEGSIFYPMFEHLVSGKNKSSGLGEEFPVPVKPVKIPPTKGWW